MKLMLVDTNAVRALVEGRSPRLDGWFIDQRCCLSAIVAAEIRYGLERRPRAKALHTLVEAVLEALEIRPWSEACALVTADQAFAQVGELSLEAW